MKVMGKDEGLKYTRMKAKGRRRGVNEYIQEPVSQIHVM